MREAWAKAMPFLVYVAVLVATVFGVVLEWDALIQPAPSSRHAVHAVNLPSPPPQSPLTKNDTDLRAVRAANPTTPAPDHRAPVTQQSANAPPVSLNQAGSNPAGASADAAAAISAAEPAPAPPQCDIEACAAAYGSFRASDCTWQPYDGPRRLCTKGAAADAASDAAAANARADGDAPVNPLCHYRTCAEHYSSFNPSDCTYQPLNGPRRRCKK
jgi:hypothetical protein